MSYTGSKAKVGRGTVVSIGGVTGATGSETFVPIEELMDASFKGGVWGTVEVTNFDSGVNDEFINTTRSNGDVSLKGNLIDGATGQTALSTAYGTGDKHNFKVQLLPGPGQTSGTLYAFSALVTSFLDIAVTTKGAVEFTSNLKISGAITVTAGA